MQPDNKTSHFEEVATNMQVAKKVAVFTERGAKNGSKFDSRNRLYLLLCDVGPNGLPLVPSIGTAAPKSYHIEESYGATRRYKSTRFLFQKLETEINQGKISYDNAIKIAIFLADTKAKRSTLHEYVTEKNLFTAVKACLKNPELSLISSLEKHCSGRSKVLGGCAPSL